MVLGYIAGGLRAGAGFPLLDKPLSHSDLSGSVVFPIP